MKRKLPIIHKQPKKIAPPKSVTLPTFSTYPASAINLGGGLPVNLLENEDGMPRIRKLLNFTGEKLNWFLNISIVKTPLKTAQLKNASKNKKLLTILSIPYVRLMFFAWAVDDLLRDGTTRFDSLEVYILRNFDEKFLTGELNGELLAKELPEIYDLIDEEDSELNLRFAMLWIPFIKALKTWESIDTKDKNALINVAFALITLMQKVEALEYVLHVRPELEEYIGFMRKSENLTETDELEDDDIEDTEIKIDCDNIDRFETLDAILDAIASTAKEAQGKASLTIIAELRCLLEGAERIIEKEKEDFAKKHEIEKYMATLLEELNRFSSREGLEWIADCSNEIVEFWSNAIGNGEIGTIELNEVINDAELVADSIDVLRAEKHILIENSESLERAMPTKANERMKAMKKLQTLSDDIARNTASTADAMQEILSILMPDSSSVDEQVIEETQLTVVTKTDVIEIESETVIEPDVNTLGAKKPLNDLDPSFLNSVEVEQLIETGSILTDNSHIAAVLDMPIINQEIVEQSEMEALSKAKDTEDEIDFENEDLTLAHVPVVENKDIVSEKSEARVLTWHMVAQRRFSLAYNLARFCEYDDETENLELDSNVLKVVNLAPFVRYDSGDIAKTLKTCFETVSTNFIPEVGLLLAGAALRPALLAPISNAGTILKSVKPGSDLVHFYKYCQIIGTFGESHQPLDLIALNRANNLAAWKDELKSLQKDAKVWLEQAQYQSLIGPANRVWKKWLEQGELVREAITPVIKDDRRKMEEVKKLFSCMTNDNEIEREIEKTDKKLRNIRRSGDEIISKALGGLKNHLREGARFIQQWFELIESEPCKDLGFKHKQAEKLRQDVIDCQDKVIAEINTCIACENSIVRRIALEFSNESVKSIKNLLSPDASLPSDEILPNILLNADLLRLSGISLDENWEPREEDKSVICEQLAKLVEFESSWESIYYQHAELKNHASTGKIIELLKCLGDPGEECSTIELLRSASISELIKNLYDKTNQTRNKVEEAYSFGILRDSQRIYAISEIDAIDTTMAFILDFALPHNILDKICDMISTARECQIEEVRNQMVKRGINKKHTAFAKINALLDLGDVLTANEYIEMVQSGQELPVFEAETDHFHVFFPQMANFLYEYLNNESGLSSVITKVKNRNFPELEMKNVPGAQAEQASAMLESWYQIKREERLTSNTDKMANVLKGLGFSSPRVTVDNSAQDYRKDRVRNKTILSHAWGTAHTDKLGNKSICPISMYGSGAEGNYRILCVWGRPSEEDVAQLVGDTSHANPTIVMYFGCMTDQRRRGLAKHCRQEKSTFILIDDILMVFLCGIRGSRLQAMFRCTLPFTFFEPYIATGGLVPVEMFYGRTSERNSIISALESSASIIYGGRQLGKTALLMEVERSFTDRAEGKIALYVDLKGEAIELDEIWSLLARKFRSLEVLEPNINVNIDGRKLMGLIEQWLKALSGRRIILLLDEADRFLESDCAIRFFWTVNPVLTGQ